LTSELTDEGPLGKLSPWVFTVCEVSRALPCKNQKKKTNKRRHSCRPRTALLWSSDENGRFPMKPVTMILWAIWKIAKGNSAAELELAATNFKRFGSTPY